MAVMSKASESEGPAVTEANVQRELFTWLRSAGHDLIVPNTSMAFGWESDLVSVTSAGYLCDYEIKTSRADWLRELRAADSTQVKERDRSKWRRHQILCGEHPKPCVDRRGDVHAPSRFWVVAPEGVVHNSELPAYAGLILVRPHERVPMLELEKARQAPMLHRNKASTRDVRTLARGLMLRLWDYERVGN